MSLKLTFRLALPKKRSLSYEFRSRSGREASFQTFMTAHNESRRHSKEFFFLLKLEK